MQGQEAERRATADHLLLLTEPIKIQNNAKEPVCFAFVDVTKVYDKI